MSKRKDEREERRLRALRAGADLLLEAHFDWTRSLTFQAISNSTDISATQLDRDFGNKDAFVDALIDYCSDPSNFDDFGDDWSSVVVDEIVGALFDPDTALYDAAVRVGELDFRLQRNDKRIRPGMAMWVAAEKPGRERDALRRQHHYYANHQGAAWVLMMEEFEAAGIVATNELSVDETVTVLGSLIKGLVLRWSVDPEAVSEDLFGRVVAMLMSVLFTDDSDGPKTSKDRLQVLDALRERHRSSRPFPFDTDQDRASATNAKLGQEL